MIDCSGCKNEKEVICCRYSFCERELEAHDLKIRNDAIEEFAEKLIANKVKPSVVRRLLIKLKEKWNGSE